MTQIQMKKIKKIMLSIKAKTVYDLWEDTDTDGNIELLTVDDNKYGYETFLIKINVEGEIVFDITDVNMNEDIAEEIINIFKIVLNKESITDTSRNDSTRR